MKLTDHLAKLDAALGKSFQDLPEIETVSSINMETIPKEINKWLHLEDAVAVFADLQGSTRLAYQLTDRESAAVVETAIKAIVETLYECQVRHAQIQGDGAYGVFYGPNALENAMVAAITIQTFSVKTFSTKVETNFKDAPETGIKIGVAAGPVIVKKLGKIRNAEFQDESWVGIPVNFASKAASSSEPGNLVVTASIWDRIWDNEYLTLSCVCNAEKRKTELWQPFEIKSLSDFSGQEAGYTLGSTWCINCGPSFVEHVLAGDKRRDSDEDARLKRARQKTESLNKVAEQKRKNVKAYKKVR